MIWIPLVLNVSGTSNFMLSCFYVYCPFFLGLQLYMPVLYLCASNGHCQIGSSLWEIDTLRHHYCPPVSRYVTYSWLSHFIHLCVYNILCFVFRFGLSLENDLTVRAKTTEVNIQDFSSGSYATIFGDEVT